MRSKKKEEVNIVEPTTICYCEGERRVGEIELHCAGCRKWYHQSCLKDLKAFYGLPFMVCYQFYCKPCSSTKKEVWTVKQANFSQMLVMVLSNLTHNWRKLQSSDADFNQKFFSLEHDIIPFFEREWDNLTSMPKRKKDSWHQTIQNALEKHPDLFVQRSSKELYFKLKENDLRKIGPFLDAVRYINRRPNASQNNQNDDADENEGPKTRGAAKRKNAEGGGGGSKKQKTTNDYASVYIREKDDFVDFPYNRDGYRYFFVEPDNNCPYSEEELTGLCVPGAIPSVSYRLYNYPVMTLAPNDRAHQLKLSEDRMTLSGVKNLGYCAARATHMVSKGKWYYEVSFDKQAAESHIRVGFAQELLPLQACVGYTKLSYGFRSKHGTKFHDSIGTRYFKTDYKQGDVIGCLIDIPEPSRVTSQYLPQSKKDMILVSCKGNMFYEQKDDLAGHLKQLTVCKGSRIEFFLNGVSCGVAFSDIYAGQYFPAVSIYQDAQVTCNFGPKLKYRPKGARPFYDRLGEYAVEQTISDMIGTLEWKERQIEEKKKMEKEKGSKARGRH
uniref:B30.2/SPRY domain-containing protein n=1 Tax=Steinernema glaseri TaxID=37863 RepID=A0A1I7ZT62_9BILA